jgi:hypothetical protein
MTEKASSRAIQDVPNEDVTKAVSRRNFIKGVITSGVTVSLRELSFSRLVDSARATVGFGESASD